MLALPAGALSLALAAAARPLVVSPRDAPSSGRGFLPPLRGDLLVVEAEKVMEEHGINDDLGMVRLARVYDILDGGKCDPIGTEDVDVEPSSEPIDFVRLEKALDAKFFKFTHYKGTGGGF